MKTRVLFICTRNSARSQMAEAFLNGIYGEKYEAKSAGTDPGEVNPLVIKAMGETGFDLSQARSKSIAELSEEDFEIVVTLCGNAKKSCPILPGAKRYIHRGFAEPAVFEGTDDDKLEKIRAVREEMREWVGETFRR